MAPFRPAEIRIIIIITLLAIAGSIVILLQRHGKMSQFDLGNFAYRKDYRYSNRVPSSTSRDSINQAFSSLSNRKDSTAALPKINLNKCGYYDFEALPGIGPAIATRIVAYRDSIGGFQKISDLLKVKGIGPAKYSAIKDRVTVE